MPRSLALVVVLVSGIAAASPPLTIPVSEVKAGMIGYGLTVFAGTQPERFPVRVVDVLRRFLPKQDVILIRSEDPRLVHSGVVAGMSGSPIYLETPAGDRLAGALAYGWSFAKDPIAGVTPIENMLAELERPRRGRDASPAAEARAVEPPPAGEAVAATGEVASRLRPVAVPLAVAGLAPSLVESLQRALGGDLLAPVAAGGATATGPGPAGFVAGSAIAVQLARGDVSLAATGTVTWVDGDRVLAFGHPMFGAGEVYLPVATATIHTFMSSLATSFKVASPIREVGTLVQDRQPGIVVDTAVRADMIPLHVTVRSGSGAPHVFHVEVARHRFLTPLLVSTVIANAFQEAASDVAAASTTLRLTLGVRGQAPIELLDEVFAVEGLSPKVLGGASGLRAMQELLFNPFAPVHFDRIDVDATVAYRPDVAEVRGVALLTEELGPGTRPSLLIALRPYAGAEYTRTVPIDVPVALAGQTLRIEAAAGPQVKPDLAAPESLADLIANLRQGWSGRSLVVTVETADEDLTLRGRLLANLPASVADTLRPGASSRRGEGFKRSARIIVPMPVIVTGKQSLQVRVRELSPR